MLELCHHVRCAHKKQHDVGVPFAVIPPHLTPRLGLSNEESNEESQNIHASKNSPDKLAFAIIPPCLTLRLGLSNEESNEESQNVDATKSLPDKLRMACIWRHV